MSIQRVVVGFEAPLRARLALATAADLARRMDAELVGLLVENENLIRLAGLPFASEIGFPSALTRGIDPKRMERSLRAMAENSRQVLEAIARRRLAGPASGPSLRWSLRVTRGEAVPQMLSSGDPADLLVIATSLWAPGFAPPPELTRSTVLLLHGNAALAAPALLVCTPGEPAARLAAALAQFSPVFGNDLGLLLLCDDPHAARTWLHTASPAFAKHGLNITATRVVSPHDTESALHAVEHSPAGVIILADARPETAGLRERLRASRRPMLLLPPDSAA